MMALVVLCWVNWLGACGVVIFIIGIFILIAKDVCVCVRTHEACAGECIMRGVFWKKMVA